MRRRGGDSVIVCRGNQYMKNAPCLTIFSVCLIFFLPECFPLLIRTENPLALMVATTLQLPGCGALS